MNNVELEAEAHQWNIEGYMSFDSDFEEMVVDRQIIINALIGKDKANDSRLAIFISAIALIVSILVFIFR